MMALAFDGVAEEYPQRPISLVVGYAPGGGADVLSRHLAEYMTNELGQKVIVENRIGATGSVAALSVMRSAPDGYTVYMAGSSVLLHQLMYGKGKLNLATDLTPVGMAAGVPIVLVMGKHVPGATLLEAIEIAKKKSATLRCASNGVGSSGDFLCHAVQKTAGVEMIHVPYKGDAQALADVVGGRADFYVSSLVGTLAFIKADRVRAMAVIAESRCVQLPDVPSIDELGFKNATAPGWYGLMVPNETPSYVISRLNQSLNAVLEMTDVRTRLMELGYVVPSLKESPERFEKRISEDTKKWSEILRMRGMEGLH